jgi:hypothetical protein
VEFKTRKKGIGLSDHRQRPVSQASMLRAAVLPPESGRVAHATISQPPSKPASIEQPRCAGCIGQICALLLISGVEGPPSGVTRPAAAEPGGPPPRSLLVGSSSCPTMSLGVACASAAPGCFGSEAARTTTYLGEFGLGLWHRDLSQIHVKSAIDLAEIELMQARSQVPTE